MGTGHMPWSYGAHFYLEIVDEAKAGHNRVVDLPRRLCAVLLFLRAAHECHARDHGINHPDLEPKDMVAFVWEAKNAIIHDGEGMSLVVGGKMPEELIPPGHKGLALRISDIDMDFGKNKRSGSSETTIRLAYGYQEKHAGSALRAVHAAILETAALIDEESDLVSRVREHMVVFTN